jgi:hypothetical protein
MGHKRLAAILRDARPRGRAPQDDVYFFFAAFGFGSGFSACGSKPI